MSKKFEFRLVFLRKINSIYVIERVKTLKNSTETTYTYKEKTYTINYSIPAYLKDSTRFKKKAFVYFFDVENAKQLSYSEQLAQINPDLLKIIIKTNVMSQIAKSLNDDIKKIPYTLVIICSVMFGLIGAMGMYMYMQSKTGV